MGIIYWLLWLIVTPLWFVLFPTRIVGKRNLKPVKKEATILSSNHQSLNDPIIIKSRVKPTSKMMAKSELFKSKFVAGFLKMLGGYPVNREGNDVSAVRTTLALLKNDKTVTIFPEGTRGDTGELNALKNGLAMFALKTDSYVVPMCFKKKPRMFVFNTLLIGKPFKFSDLEEFKGQKVTRELVEKASAVLSEKMAYLKDVSTKEYKKLLKEKK